MNCAVEYIKQALIVVFRARYPNGLESKETRDAHLLVYEMSKEITSACAKERQDISVVFQSDAIPANKRTKLGLVLFDGASRRTFVVPITHLSNLIWIGENPRPVFLGHPEGPVALLDEVFHEIDKLLESAAKEKAES